MKKYQIDAEMCGDEATDDIARRVAEILSEEGFDCEFAEFADNQDNHDAIPDDRFFAAVGRAANEVVAEGYEVWLVPNGRLDDFQRGQTGAGWPDACCWWGTYKTLDDVRDAYADWAAENFDRDGGIGEGFADDAERNRARDEEIARARQTLSIEWQDDLKWVKTRKIRELRSGDTEFVEVV